MTTLDRLRELRRCLLSTQGYLDAVCDHMPVGPHGFALRAHLEGGSPESHAILDAAIRDLGGPERDDDETCTKSFDRGYQVAMLMAREEKSGERDPEAWKQDPAEFMAALAQEGSS